ncbi:hypothetical protein BDA96_06G271400 [Sorghum bicolor]|uniref:Uncharacterized protein n=1 Tax=Sorghum bicolor TaxID=4558 RepID=A0A921QW52_SORBI|nr:hypothetical protein BDA96_06G271400 [Sorghum bicolor]
MSSLLHAVSSSSGGAPAALEAEVEEKLVLYDDDDSAPPPAAPPQIKRGERRLQPRREGSAADVVGDHRERFLRAYDRLRDELLDDDSCELTDEATRWVAQMIDYNVPGGKLNRGLSVIDSYLLLKQGSEVAEDEFFLACVLGWCVEWFQACALLLDDIMDDSHTRRDQICWYRRPEVGLHGINDGILLKCHIARLIKKYFREKPYYIDICELWNEIALQTSLGQMLDLISTHNVANDVAKYNIEGYRRIVKYKTSYYSFYLPVACALLLCGTKLENISGLRDVLIEMGIYFQAQDDYLDCFADPNTIGKIGTDIEDHKCSWLIVQALSHANSNEIEVLLDIFSEFEDRAYKHLVTSIEDQHDHAVQEILKSFLKKIHRRKK